jgi:formamidopyrimidine-DNA glycosylase
MVSAPLSETGLAMPELPEVETTRRGLEPHIIGKRIQSVLLRRDTLRWPIPFDIVEKLPGQKILGIERRAKYLLMHTAAGSALWHLGMSGSMRVLKASAAAGKHDHVDVVLSGQKIIRFTDPRRFGCLLWQAPHEIHPLLQKLGPEPLSSAFTGDYLFRKSRGKSLAVKSFLMDQAVVVGVGNIYAAESLFRAGISPLREAGSLSKARYEKLAEAAKEILAYAIERGGTTLRDFINPDSEPGYFEQELDVYGREGEPCKQCGRALRDSRLNNRAGAWCGFCQS